MTYIPAPIMIAVDPKLAQAFATLVPAHVLGHRLQTVPPEVRRAVLDSYRAMVVQVRWFHGHQGPAEATVVP